MKLCIEDDEETRPDHLTSNFFADLMITEAKKRGILQIISFKRKRDLVFSTKISDGFFEVKVMVVQEAAKQIQRGQIQDHYILQGSVRNHGDGVIVIKEHLQFWKYSRVVGKPVTWKLKRENVNGRGDNFIVWNSQFLNEIHLEKTQSIQRQSSFKKAKEQEKPLSRGRKKKQQKNSKDETKIIQKEMMQEQRKVASVRGVSEQKNKKSKNKKSGKSSNKRKKKEQKQEEIKPSKKYQQKKNESQTVQIVETQKQIDQKKQATLITDSMETLSLDVKPKSQKKKSQKKDERPMSQKMKNFIFALYDSDEEGEKVDQQIQKSEIKVLSPQKEASKVDLQFILNCLDDDYEEPKTSYKKQQKKQEAVELNCQDEDEDVDCFFEWFNKRNKPAQIEKTPLKESNAKKKQEMYKYLMSSSSDEQQLSKVDQVNSKMPEQNELKFEDIYHGIYAKIPDWTIKAILRCVSEPFPKDYVHAIVTDRNSQYLITAVFKNYSALEQVLEEGRLYKFAKGIIKSNLEHNRWNSSHCQLEFDCLKSSIEKMQPQEDVQEVLQRSQNYTSIDKIYDLDDGQVLHCFGLIKSVKNIVGKNSFITNCQIIDPIVKYVIIFTKFDSKEISEELSNNIGSAITIYNAGVSSYKGKKNIVGKPKTIIKVNWLPFTEEANSIREWLQNQQNTIQNVDLNLVGFVHCNSLRRVQIVPDSQVFVPNVTILNFSQKHTYVACVKCFKKIEENRCRTCGKRSPEQIIQRLLVRSNIGDRTTILSVGWGDSMTESIANEGIRAFEAKWILKNVDVWLEKGNNGFITLLKAKHTEVKQRIQNLFSYIKGRLL